ncbi:MAG: hypothetical protein K2O18_17060 [Oscillospiraceae bacterium]|nr:hypothetical protein [Oscillospiraceae bacterium]
MPDRSVIHKYAAAGAATAGALPVGADAVALAAEEVAMVIQIGSLFGISLSKAGAEGIIAAYLGGLVGGTIFEVANVGYPFTIPVKIAIATGVIEGLGNAAYNYFEKCSEKGQL